MRSDYIRGTSQQSRAQGGAGTYTHAPFATNFWGTLLKILSGDFVRISQSMMFPSKRFDAIFSSDGVEIPVATAKKRPERPRNIFCELEGVNH